MNFSKINQSKISQLEKEYMSKIKGGDDPDDNDGEGGKDCSVECYRWWGNRYMGESVGVA